MCFSVFLRSNERELHSYKPLAAFIIVKGEVFLYRYITNFNVLENGIVIYDW